MKKYKILIKNENNRYVSPFQNYDYGMLEDFLNKEMICENFDNKQHHDCSYGFYATNLDGLIYVGLESDKYVVFEMEMYGDNVQFSNYKHRFEKQKFIREIPRDELKSLIKEYSKNLDYDLYNCLFLENPFNKPKVNNITIDDIEHLKIYAKNWELLDDVYYFDDSIINHILRNLNTLIFNNSKSPISTITSIDYISKNKFLYAYINQFFYDNELSDSFIKSVNYLFNRGLIPSYNSYTQIWNLHSEIEYGDVIYTIHNDELLK